MKAGEWRELKTEGYEAKALMRGEDILAYSGRAAWDGKNQQVLFMGQVHLKGPPVFIRYALADNRWQRQPTPPWAESLKWFHAYENNAADSENGIFYHHQSDARLIHKYVVAAKEWTTLPELKAPTGHGTALEFFPQMKGLIHVLHGEVWLYSEAKGTWSQLANKLDMGPYHNFASYSARHKVVLFGGGNDSGALHVLSADGTIKAGKRAPVDVGIGRALTVVDPASGDLLVLAKKGRLHAYDPGKDAWRELPAENVPFNKYEGHSVSAAPIPNHGVVLVFSSLPQGMKTYLYKHSDSRK
jgi:hypothetical protein